MAKTGTKAKKFTRRVDVNSIRFDTYIEKMAKQKGISCQSKTVKQLSSIVRYLLLRTTHHANDCVLGYAKGQTLSTAAIKTGLNTMVPSGLRADAVKAGDAAVAKLLASLAEQAAEKSASAAEPSAEAVAAA